MFTAQVDLLLRILPYVMRDHFFALKGGSVLNLLVRNLPRLLVNINLTYFPIQETSKWNRIEHDIFHGEWNYQILLALPPK
jgi:hypothetical protein